MKKLLIIDGNSLANRAFYALPLLTNENGEYSNVVYGFANILIKFIVEQKPDYITVAFDHSRHTFRTDMYAEYKGTRKEMPSEMREQMPVLKQFLEKMNIKIWEIPGIEADDIIGTIAKHSNVQNIILSGDRDVLQLIDKNTEVWLTKKGISEVEKVNENNMEELFGFSPSQVIDMKSLMGDTADNIPGVSGVGEKTALNLIQTYKTLCGVYNNIDSINGKLKEKLISEKDKAELSYTLATIKTDCDINVNIDDFCYDFPFNENVKNMCERYQFKSILKRPELFSENKIENKKNNIKKIELNNINELKNILKNKINYFSFNFINNIEFCINKEIVYTVAAQQTLFNDISLDEIINNIKFILQDENIIKITYDLKAHFAINNAFLSAKNICDISIMSYLTSAGEGSVEKFEVSDYYDKMLELGKELEDKNLSFIYNEIEMPLTYILHDMEQNGFYIKSENLNDVSKKYEEELLNLSASIYEKAGHEFNINSPKQLSAVLFDELCLDDRRNKKHSTSIDVLNDLANDNDIVPLIIRYRKIQKLNSTYIEVYKKLVLEKGECIHTTYNQTLTATGRLSSSEPNLQNIPVRDEEGKNLRKLFVSRFNCGYIVSADYSQIELRLLASLCKDENLLNAYNNGEDIHSKVASQIFNIPLSEVNANQRRISKAVNFGIIYGISAFGLSNQIGVNPKSAKEFMDKYFEKYPKVVSYMQSNVEFAKEHGYAQTIYGRIRKIPELESENHITKSFGERVAYNMPLQGTASDIIKIAMIKVANELEKQNLKSKLILQIHDELIVDSPSEELEKVQQILKNCMESVNTELPVKLCVNISYGKTWFDAK